MGDHMPRTAKRSHQRAKLLERGFERCEIGKLAADMHRHTAQPHAALACQLAKDLTRFADRYTAALIHKGGEGDKAALAELDMFRKDVGSFVRLYDFMSQIIDYGDPELEKKQIYLRLLDRFIQSENSASGAFLITLPEKFFSGNAATVIFTG